MTERYGALSGVRVIDLAGQFPGALCTMMLADAGADIIKLERPGGDPFRHERAVFAVTGRSKKSIVVDLKTADGKNVLWKLIDRSDILIEEQRPGKLDTLGFGYDAVCRRRPQMVYCSLSGFGQTGPWRDLPGHDLSYMALAGSLHTWVCDAGPIVPAISFADIAAAMLAAYAISLGLFEARVSGRGQRIDSSLFDAGLFVGMLDYGQWFVSGIDPQGSVNRAIPHYRLFRCAGNTTLALAIVNEDPFWRGLTQALGLHEWKDYSQADRLEHNSEIAERLQEIFMRSPAETWQTLLLAHDVPCGKVLSPGQALNGDHVSARAFARRDRSTTQLLTPIASPAMVGAPGASPPDAGEHTRELLKELCYSDDEIDRLIAAHVVFTSEAH